MVSRVCEEFGCLPSEAVRELERNGPMCDDIIYLRSFARAKEWSEKDDDAQGLMVDQVMEIRAEVLREVKAKRAGNR